MDTLVQKLLTMADSTVEYDGTLESFKKEFQKEIDEHPDLAKQFGLFDCMVKQRDIEHAERMAKRIALIQNDRDNTILMDHYDSVMNTLTEWYGFKLLTCPDCWEIHQYSNWHEWLSKCFYCNTEFSEEEASDLFF